MSNSDTQVKLDAAHVRATIPQGPLGWSNEAIYRLLIDLTPHSFDETCAMFAYVDRVQAELRR